MRKNFNSFQMFETSENCDKFSKSVSYETLVGGTATAGTGIKQSRRLSKGSADKPLTAVGTLTSLLCNSAKVMENMLQMSPVLRLIKVLGLVTVLSVGIISESSADCWATEHNQIKSCYNTWEPGKPNNCGDGCTYTYNNGKLTVTATKPDAVIPNGFFASKYYENGVFPKVTGIKIAGEFKTIGTHAFLDNRTTISGQNGVLYTNSIDHNAFGNDNTLTGTIIVSDKQTTLVEGPWYNANLNATVILPPTIKSISGMTLYGLNLGPNAKIYCGVENCEELFNEKACDSLKGDNAQYKTTCQKNLTKLLSSGKLLAYPDGCTKMGASGCTKCKNENFKLNDGECDRLRWTPAEAAKVLKDDNTNEVTITFKK